MADEFEGEAPSPFDDWQVDARTMMILLDAAGWTWDYWGKFYGPAPHYPKVRDPRWVLQHIRSAWRCPDVHCDCDPGCPCCSPGECHHDGWTQPACWTASAEGVVQATR